MFICGVRSWYSVPTFAAQRGHVGTSSSGRTAPPATNPLDNVKVIMHSSEKELMAGTTLEVLEGFVVIVAAEKRELW
jgi:hypothetical protein